MLRALAVTCVLVGSVAVVAAQPKSPPDPAATYSVAIDPSTDGVVGAADAKVTVVTGTEYACPYCEKVHATFAELAKKYGKDVRFVYRQFIVHPQLATVSSVAACAAQRQGAWQAMDARLWDAFRAREFDPTSCLDDPKTCKFVGADLAALKLDERRFWAEVPACRKAIAAAQAAWATDLHVDAIPTMFINGRFLRGAQPPETFEKVIDAELARATAAIRHGVKPERYYEEAVVARGVKALPPDPVAPPQQPPVGGGAVPPGIMARPPTRPSPSATVTYAVPIDPSIDGIVGPADAKLTLVIASDYACPYCEKMEPVLADLAAHYGRDLRIVHRQFVVHPTNAIAFALAACAATRQHAFTRFDALLWDDYRARKWDAGECWTDPAGCPLIDAHVRDLKLDHRRFVGDMIACKAPIADAHDAWMNKLGAQAIPTVFINGRFIQGAQPAENFVKIADEELAKATERIRHGARAATYYHDWVEVKGTPDLATPAP